MSLVMMPFDRPHTISYQSFIAICNYVSILHRFQDLFPKNLRGHVTEHIHIPFGGSLSYVHLVLLCVDQYTAFAVPSFTDSKHTIWGKIFKNGSRDPDNAHQGVVYYPKANEHLIYSKDYDLYTKIGDSRFSHSGDMITGVESKGCFVSRKIVLDIVYLYAKFNDSSFSGSAVPGISLMPSKI